MTLPLLATVYEHFYRGDRRDTTLAQKLLRYGPLWLVCLGYFLLRVRVLGAFAHTTGMHLLSRGKCCFPPWPWLANTWQNFSCPVHLSAFHAFHPSTSVFDAHVLRGAMALSLFAGIFGVLWKRARPASFGILWLFFTLVPVLNARWMSALRVCGALPLSALRGILPRGGLGVRGSVASGIEPPRRLANNPAGRRLRRGGALRPPHQHARAGLAGRHHVIHSSLGGRAR